MTSIMFIISFFIEKSFSFNISESLEKSITKFEKWYSGTAGSLYTDPAPGAAVILLISFPGREHFYSQKESSGDKFLLSVFYLSSADSSSEASPGEGRAQMRLRAEIWKREVRLSGSRQSDNQRELRANISYLTPAVVVGPGWAGRGGSNCSSSEF